MKRSREDRQRDLQIAKFLSPGSQTKEKVNGYKDEVMFFRQDYCDLATGIVYWVEDKWA